MKMIKKVLSVLLPLMLFISCGAVTSTKPIEKDCEYLKTLLPEVSIQFSQVVDEGLDWESFFKDLRTMYISSSWTRFRKTPLDENGVNTDAFAYGLAWAMQKTLSKKDGHMSARGASQSIYPFCPKFVYASDLLFEKKSDGYYVIENQQQSQSKKIKPGMKYSGDEENLVPEYSSGGLLYRFVEIKDYIKNNKTQILLDGKKYDIPVKFDGLIPEKSKDILFEEKDDILTVVMKTMSPRLEENTLDYEKTTEEICKKINNYSTVVFDFRDNHGGYLERFTPILAAMIFGELDGLNDERVYQLNDYLYTGKVDMFTKTVANRRILEGNMMSAFYHEHKDERYYTYPEPEKKPELSNKAFKGKIFVITNTSTYSAAEYSLAALKFIFKDQVIQLGMKTGGMLDFGGAYTYMLPDSKLKVHLCCGDLSGMMVLAGDSGWRGDTEGFYPDVWFFSDNEKAIRKYVMENK